MNIKNKIIKNTHGGKLLVSNFVLQSKYSSTLTKLFIIYYF